jgi:hypothetical protein
MRKATVLLAALAAVSAASAADAQQLRYFGRPPGEPKGWVETEQGALLQVGAGDALPGWGVVSEVDDRYVVIQHRLADEDKAALAAQGEAVYDVLEIQLNLTGPHAPAP